MSRLLTEPIAEAIGKLLEIRSAEELRQAIAEITASFWEQKIKLTAANLQGLLEDPELRLDEGLASALEGQIDSLLTGKRPMLTKESFCKAITALREANKADPRFSVRIRRPARLPGEKKRRSKKGRRFARIGFHQVSRSAQTDAIHRQDKAVKAGIRRAVAGEPKAGFPHHKRRQDYTSLGGQIGGFRLKGDQLFVPGIPGRLDLSRWNEAALRGFLSGKEPAGKLAGKNEVALRKLAEQWNGIQMVVHRPWQGEPKYIVIGRDPDGCAHVAIQCTEVPAKPLPACKTEIGIDLGINKFAVIYASDGTVTEIPNPTFGAQVAPLKARAQRATARKREARRGRTPGQRRQKKERALRNLELRESRQALTKAQKRKREALRNALARPQPKPAMQRGSKHLVKALDYERDLAGYVARCGKDFNHKVSTGLVSGGTVSGVAGVEPFVLRPAGRIAYEKIAARDMMHSNRTNPKIYDSTSLNRRSADTRFGQFGQLLESKVGPGRVVTPIPAQKGQKAGGTRASAKRILEAGRVIWSAPPSNGSPSSSGGTQDKSPDATAEPGTGAGSSPERRAPKRRPRGAGGSGALPTRKGVEASSAGSVGQPGGQHLAVEASNLQLSPTHGPVRSSIAACSGKEVRAPDDEQDRLPVQGDGA